MDPPPSSRDHVPAYKKNNSLYLDSVRLSSPRRLTSGSPRIASRSPRISSPRAASSTRRVSPGPPPATAPAATNAASFAAPYPPHTPTQPPTFPPTAGPLLPAQSPLTTVSTRRAPPPARRRRRWALGILVGVLLILAVRWLTSESSDDPRLYFRGSQASLGASAAAIARHRARVARELIAARGHSPWLPELRDDLSIEKSSAENASSPYAAIQAAILRDATYAPFDATSAADTTAIVLSHSRPKNVRAIAAQLEALPFIRRVHVWNNGPAWTPPGKRPHTAWGDNRTPPAPPTALWGIPGTSRSRVSKFLHTHPKWATWRPESWAKWRPDREGDGHPPDSDGEASDHDGLTSGEPGLAAPLSPAASTLSVYNSPANLLFVARFLACAASDTPYCYVQDDDYYVGSIRPLYAEFKRNPSLVTVAATPAMESVYGLEWCFNSPTISLHTCFAWLGTGAFFSRAQARSFLGFLGSHAVSSRELAHADNFFTTLQNTRPKVVTTGEIIGFAGAGRGYSTGSVGLARNKELIGQGLKRLVSSLLASETAPAPVGNLNSRAACRDDTCFFISNIQNLPPFQIASSINYNVLLNVPDHEMADFVTKHETKLGWASRGYSESHTGMYRDEERWSLRWPYAAAVDGKRRTAFRSRARELRKPKAIAFNDYIGLGLVAPPATHVTIDGKKTPRVVDLNFVFENVDRVLPRLAVELSADGANWKRILDLSPLKDTADGINKLCSPDRWSLRHPLGRRSSLEKEDVGSQKQGFLKPVLKTCSIPIYVDMNRYAEEDTSLPAVPFSFARLIATHSVDDMLWGVYDIWVGESV